MSDSEQIVKRFSMRTYLKDRQRRTGINPVYESSHILKSIMEELIESDPDASQEDWARYFLKFLIEFPKNYQIFSWVDISLVEAYLTYFKICNELLFNYLQPVCWTAAVKIHNDIRGNAHLNLHYPVEDCFIIACEFAIQPAKVLRSFNFKPDSCIDAYALNAFKRIIKNQISKELKSKSVKLSDNGLLRTLEKKELVKALTNYGLKLNEIELLCLAWQSFKELFAEIYPPNNSDGSRRKNFLTTPLNDSKLSQIAARYNQQVRRLRIDTKPADGKSINQMLAKCIQAVRSSQQIRSIPLEDYGTGEVTAPVANPVEMAIKEEESDKLAQINKIILREFKALDALAQKSLLLWLGLRINQEDFLLLLQLEKQYQVARKFQGDQKTILKALVQFSFQHYLGQNLSDKEANQIAKNNLDYLKEYLMIYSQAYFREILAEILTEEISREEKTILIDYLEERNEYIKAKKRGENISAYPLRMSTKYWEVKQKITTILRSCLEKKLQISLEQFSSAEKSLTNLIESYLQENTAILY